MVKVLHGYSVEVLHGYSVEVLHGFNFVNPKSIVLQSEIKITEELRMTLCDFCYSESLDS